MRKLLAAALLLVANIALGAPAYVTYNTPNGTIPVIFGAQNVTAGDQIYFLGFTNSSGTSTFAMNGSQTTMSNTSVIGPSPCTGGCLNFSDGHGDTFSLFAGLSAGTPPTVASSAQNTSNGIWTTGTNTYTVNQPITITGTPPTGFLTGTTYYIISAGLSTTTIELSATQGGAVLLPTGTSACTLNTIQQNFTVSQPSGDQLANSWQLEFSGGVSTKSPLYTTTASPGAGTGAVPGQTVTVATGDILVAICYDGDVFGNPCTINNAGWPSSPTEINVNNSSVAYYFVGTGGSVTPSFNAAVADLTTPHQVVQWIVSATGITTTTFGPVQPKFSPFMTGANDDLYHPFQSSRRRLASLR